MPVNIRAGLLAISAFCLCCHSASAQIANLQPVTDDMLQSSAAADWLMWHRTHDSWGFSPLDQINTQNVSGLELVWTVPLEEGGIQEGTPLVYDGVMFMPEPNDVVTAMDAATGEVFWQYRREMPDDLQDYIAAATTNRTLAVYDDLIIYTSNDDYLVGLDMHTGEVRYEQMIQDYRELPAQQSNGPIIISGMAVSGRGCMPQAGPDACVITAHDALTGEERWRFNTIQKEGEGDDSWGLPWDMRWHVGAWMMPSYDPELDLIYMGTSVTAPAPKFLINGNEGEYLYHNSTLAINPEDGTLEWYYQHLVDHWDLDHPFARLLVNTRVAPDPAEVDWINPDIDSSREYSVLTGIPGKTGVVYTLDRETGEFLWARDTIFQNVVGDIDGTTGKATVNPEALFHETGDTRDICPSSQGGKNWQAGTYSPVTNAMYYPLQNTCMEMTVTSEEMNNEELYGLFGRERMAEGAEGAGSIYAVSAETGKTLWTYTMEGSAMSLLSTAGGLVVGGDIAGNVRVHDDATGDVLWETTLGSTVTGYPVSFAVDGKQYIAVSTGRSVSTSNQQVFLNIDVDTESRLYVFALPE